jgi:hypothetical protein
MNPTSPRTANVSVTLPVTQAIERAKRMLFQPFDLGRWFVIGFCAWLATLGRAGGGARFNIPAHEGNGDLRHGLDEAWQFVVKNLYWIGPLAVALVLIGLILWVVCTWLSSRGRFMFLHCVALDRAEVKVPWHRFAQEGNSLCWFRIVLGLIGSVVILPPVTLVIVLIVGMVRRDAAALGGILGVIGLTLVILAAALIFALVAKLTTDFVVPIMWLRRNRCLTAWQEYLGLLSTNFWQFVLYLLFQIVLGLAIGILVLAVVVVTCCCAGCLMAIPYLGTVLLLPVLIFERAYSLYYLAQYGPAYDVFLSPERSGSS